MNAGKQFNIAGCGNDVYTFEWGNYEDWRSVGPYIGTFGLDFRALAVDYRRDRYASAEAAQKDECRVDEDDFIAWMIERAILTPVQKTNSTIDFYYDSDNRYIPQHWPECPECRKGRGEQEYGDERRHLNRVVSLLRCTNCGNEWGHHEVANNPNLPMLGDDIAFPQ